MQFAMSLRQSAAEGMCHATRRLDRQARRPAVRRDRRRHIAERAVLCRSDRRGRAQPDAGLLVGGCFADRRPRHAQRLSGVDGGLARHRHHSGLAHGDRRRHPHRAAAARDHARNRDLFRTDRPGDRRSDRSRLGGLSHGQGLSAGELIANRTMNTSMIPKSGSRFSDKIMRKKDPGAPPMNKPLAESDLATPKVTTGPIAGSRKIYARPDAAPELKVPLREIVLDASSGEPPLPVYDPSGPYTDPDATIDVEKGLPRTRLAWVKERS